MFGRAATLLAGSGGSQLIALALSPLLTRLYDPHAFGAFGIFYAVTTLAASIATLGLENAIVIERDLEQSRIALGLSLLLACAIAAAFGTTACVAWYVGLLAWMPAPLLAGLSVLALSAGNVFANRALSLDRPRAVAAGRLMRGAGIGVAQLGLAFWSADGMSLIEGAIAGQLAALATTAWLLRATPGPRRGARAERVRLLGRHRALLRWSAPQTVLNNLGNSMVPAILNGFAGGAAAVGSFTLANRVVMVPAVTVGEAMRQSLLTSMSRIAHDDAALRRLAIRSSMVVGLPLCGAAAIAIVAGPAVFAIVFGPAWREAGFDAGLLLAAQAVGIANIPAVTVITVRGWQRGLFLFGSIALPIRLASCAAGGSVAGALAVWCVLSAVTSLAVTLATLAQLRDVADCPQEAAG